MTESTFVSAYREDPETGDIVPSYASGTTNEHIYSRRQTDIEPDWPAVRRPESEDLELHPSPSDEVEDIETEPAASKTPDVGRVAVRAVRGTIAQQNVHESRYIREHLRRTAGGRQIRRGQRL